MLAKSNELKKCAFDMNQHYLQLRLFLEDETKINHRLHPMYKPIEERLFKEDEWDSNQGFIQDFFLGGEPCVQES